MTKTDFIKSTQILGITNTLPKHYLKSVSNTTMSYVALAIS